MRNRKPIVAIIGRQNVGKSTLFNRLVGRRTAIVADEPGTTRDRIFGEASWKEVDFFIVDTGGLQLVIESSLEQAVKEQIDLALAEADIIIFLVDARDGLTPHDREIAQKVRQTQKPVILAVNKVDEAQHEAAALEFYHLGLGDPLPISAYHNLGILELLDKLVSLMPPPAPAPAGPGMMKVAIVGRPNVGKSTLLNALLGEERAIVSESPGTTRDAIDTVVNLDGEELTLIDTAGIRRPGLVGTGLERYSVIRAMEAIERADIVVLLLDATEVLTAQDLHIAGYIQEAARGIILTVNKWDVAPSHNFAEYSRLIKNKLKFMPYASILFISARLKQGTDRIIPEARKIYRERQKRLSTAEVNRVVQDAVASHDLPRHGRKQLKVLYATQAAASPPTFVFFVNDPEIVHFSYQRYLENQLRRAFHFAGTPIRMVFKARSES